MDAVLLARIQFAMTIGFHFLFPPITIGLAWLLVIAEYLGWRRSDPAWVAAGRFFAKLLALTFAVGVATGIVMEFQFGTNWATYSGFVGDIFGAPLAAEAVIAFFLESGFLGLYLFGRDRVSQRVHWLSILLVAVGATISAFWIIVANSWQQTPAGFVVNQQAGRAELTSFLDAVLNPSTGLRFLHTLLASLVAGAFFMAGVSARMTLKGKGGDVAPRTLRLALAVGLAASVLVAFPSGHEHARQVAHTQPAKFAAIEGLYATQHGAPMVFFALPGVESPHLHASLEIPNVLSYLAFGDPHARVQGIEDFPPDEIPPLWLTFVSFHNMVLLGLLFIGLSLLGVLLWWRKKLDRSRRFLWMILLASPLPLAACQFGWAAAEVGRQPWIVYKLLRTSDAASAAVAPSEILASIILLGLVYLLLLGLYLFLLRREIDHGPASPAPQEVK
ncbi:MAG: cytochrome ubiquinol oxidase subunit I [Deltaproteobacteria bacterium]|nr:cytochrome ubiquinol oxidase subunit I [Deltaproteobacteria bacterium]